MLLLFGTVPERLVDSGERETGQLVRMQSLHATANEFCMYQNTNRFYTLPDTCSHNNIDLTHPEEGGRDHVLPTIP